MNHDVTHALLRLRDADTWNVQIVEGVERMLVNISAAEDRSLFAVIPPLSPAQTAFDEPIDHQRSSWALYERYMGEFVEHGPVHLSDLIVCVPEHVRAHMLEITEIAAFTLRRDERVLEATVLSNEAEQARALLCSIDAWEAGGYGYEPLDHVQPSQIVARGRLDRDDCKGLLLQAEDGVELLLVAPTATTPWAIACAEDPSFQGSMISASEAEVYAGLEHRDWVMRATRRAIVAMRGRLERRLERGVPADPNALEEIASLSGMLAEMTSATEDPLRGLLDDTEPEELSC